jgi:hypothetical protein
MPVRGTTAWRHAINQKKIINRDEGGDGRVTSSGTHYVMCAWSYCENDATELFKVRVNTGTPVTPRHMNYAFCSEKCKHHWLEELARARHREER